MPERSHEIRIWDFGMQIIMLTKWARANLDAVSTQQHNIKDGPSQRGL